MNKQKQAVATVIDLAKKGNHKWFGIYGGAGVGKTYTVNELVAQATALNMSVVVTATTGKAASLINGQTLHSYFGMRMQVNESAEVEEDAMQASDPTSEVQADILIVDEASMLGRHEVKA
ncbi:MAG: hypothetical protein DRH06_10590, partial [Deltaproteobacteria bacterium]